MTDTRQWWRNAVIYQIYPRSFADSDGDGVGDLQGVIDHLDHLVALGVDAVWISPFYRSPMVDNGYDISNYRDVDPVFGDLGTFDRLVAAAHQRGLRVITDIVVNHTSDQHPWFREAVSSPDSPRRDWYVWRDPRPGTEGHDVPVGQWRGDEPNDWGAAFSGPAWTLDPASGQYYLHLFAPEQPDLNWDNPQVREAVFEMMRWWLDRGVDGFRLDVINLVSKPEGLVGASSFEACCCGPRFHEFMAQMHDEVLDRDGGPVFTVGETPGIALDDARLTSDPTRGELSMVFQFEHVDMDHPDGKFRPIPFNLPDMKRNMARWAGLCEVGWNSLYLGNHDQPRYVSRWGDENWRERSATAWAAMLHAHPGTPFIYQGDELGMTNAHLERIEDYRDLESLNHWRQAVGVDGQDPHEVMAGILAQSRDNARTPMQWDDGPQAGFTSATPWIGVNPNHTVINAADQVGRDDSVFAFHRRLCDLRHQLDVLVDGSVSLLEADDERLWWVERTLGDQRLVAVANMSAQPLTEGLADLPEGRVVLSNVHLDGGEKVDGLAPWEVRWILVG